MSTGANASNQAPSQSGPGTKYMPTSSPAPESRSVVGPAGNSTSGTNQSDSRGPQGNG